MKGSAHFTGKVNGEVVVSLNIHSVDDLRSMTGQHLGFSNFVVVSQDMISDFAEATGDRQWIHVERELAQAGPFGRTIAHGYLILSMIPALLNEVLIIDEPSTRINYGLNRVRFVTPVLEGREVRLGVSVVSVESVDNGWQIVLDITMELRDIEKPACVAQVLYRWYPA